ncbi:hypothetical protein HaLaN_12863 [Haematococcus lacustris]|uniref:Uncharacterized protein n=1 Tax=Haematococcus lacustris TaxID=44745 RepID=A0A699Z2Z5_HAELA|nr:hypothetical protein HaLaN_12863 [Haematococcus lacustris]
MTTFEPSLKALLHSDDDGCRGSLPSYARIAARSGYPVEQPTSEFARAEIVFVCRDWCVVLAGWCARVTVATSAQCQAVPGSYHGQPALSVLLVSQPLSGMLQVLTSAAEGRESATAD